LVLILENISKAWSNFALKDIYMSIDDGEYFIILGPTGAGKTLLLETIMGFNKPDKGRIIINGLDVTSELPEKRHIGYVPQNLVLFPHMTVRENVEFGLRMHGVSKVERRKTVSHVLDLLKLTGMENRRSATLSGGEKQKVALARVLAIDPKLILLDEPLTSVDVETGRELRKELKRINKDLGKTVVHVTHDLVEGFSLGDKLALMRAGEIVQTGKAKEIFYKPRSVFAAKFLGYENVFEAKLVKSEGGFSDFDVEGLRLRAESEFDGTKRMIAIRPEDIVVKPFSINIASNTFHGTITDCSDMGSVVMVTIDVGIMLKSLMTKSSFVEETLEVGKEVWLRFKESSVKILE
jgi:ABC-type Fe3+/spermidine/putrescine transport system ATPase subunit